MYTSISFYYYVLYLVCNIREKFARYAIAERERERELWVEIRCTSFKTSTHRFSFLCDYVVMTCVVG